ncbi:TIGR00730 family Rossman fold protein [Pseudomarimonas arenosa]|uniref:Cytokinin riboside 5'-monophosphate phosphoribohydrolase n=1 Tax=Pseudomarimonas arenosa TaxID=2774145 RepID=A0AAW3ZHC8_9GAMM|nr:TIGR00730 family Rossman fold protein [Pseudomarimonas arenosa]MBD8525203.1 TIGR00730 family Rossman fold protein [Pseudomarimonas arenosa]
MRVCVYAASSGQCDPQYHQAAYALGQHLAEHGCSLVYGGGSTGSMGAVANGALSRGGEVIGILPKFMADLEWGHPGLTELQLVEDMRERKHRLLTGSDAVVALPGGCGTLEELFEAITLKRLGLYFNPILLLNTLDYWTDLDAFMHKVIDQRFMNPEHAHMWGLVEQPEQIIDAIRATPAWREDARDYAAVRPGG